MGQNTNAVMGLALLGGLAFWMFSKKSSAATAAAPMAPIMSAVTGSGPAIAPVGSPASSTAASAANAIWQNFTPIQGPGGSVNFPSGSQSASAFLPWGTDGAGNWYTMWSGQIYIVNQTPDILGNYAAKLLGT